MAITQTTVRPPCLQRNRKITKTLNQLKIKEGMKNMKLMYVLTVVVASASLLLSSCNQLNNEINNLNKGGEIVQDPTKLTLSGVIDNYHGECDELRVSGENGNGNDINKLGTCKVGSNGEFTMNMQAILNESDTLGVNTTDLLAKDVFPFPRSVEDRKSKYVSFYRMYAFKSGKQVGIIFKTIKESSGSAGGTSLFFYSTIKPFSVKRSYTGGFWGLYGYNILDYKINSGWTETVLYAHSDRSVSLTNNIPAGMKFEYSNYRDTISLLFPKVKQMVKHKVQ